MYETIKLSTKNNLYYTLMMEVPHEATGGRVAMLLQDLPTYVRVEEDEAGDEIIITILHSDVIVFEFDTGSVPAIRPLSEGGSLPPSVSLEALSRFTRHAWPERPELDFTRRAESDRIINAVYQQQVS